MPNQLNNEINLSAQINKNIDDGEYVFIEKLTTDLQLIYQELTKFNSNNDFNLINDDIIEDMLAISNTLIKEKEIETNLISILEDTSESNPFEARLIAFYTLCSKYRRKKDFDEFENLINSYRQNFKDTEIYKIQEAYNFISDVNNKVKISYAFDCWDNIDSNYKKMPAFIQIYTDTVAICFEQEIFNTNNIDHNNILDDSINLIKKAIKLRNYPKFYATLARLELQQHKYTEANNNIFKAISLEDSTRSDYSIRIAEYHSIASKIEMSIFTQDKFKELESFNIEIQELKNELSNAKYDNLSFLGFFSAVLSLIIGSIQTLSSTTITEKYQVLLALAGVIIISFGSLNLLMIKKNNIKESIIQTSFMLGLGLILFCISIFIIPLIV